MGWTSSDPTAGATLVTSEPTGLLSIWNSVKVWTRSAKGLTAVGVIALLIGVGLATAALRRRRALRPEPEIIPTDATPAAAFHRLEIALQERGRPRAQGETVRSARFRFRAGDDVTAAFGAVDEDLYSAQVPTPSKAIDAVGVLADLTAAVRDDRGLIAGPLPGDPEFPVGLDVISRG